MLFINNKMISLIINLYAKWYLSSSNPNFIIPKPNNIEMKTSFITNHYYVSPSAFSQNNIVVVNGSQGAKFVVEMTLLSTG
jgi:hypothetical protein